MIYLVRRAGNNGIVYDSFSAAKQKAIGLARDYNQPVDIWERTGTQPAPIRTVKNALFEREPVS